MSHIYLNQSNLNFTERFPVCGFMISSRSKSRVYNPRDLSYDFCNTGETQKVPIDK